MLDTTIFYALVSFALVSSITPGPNNLMLMASGANFGARRTLPHMLGVSLGFVAMVFLVGVGLAQIFDRAPIVYTAMKVLSAGFIVYLSWKIATAAEIAPQTNTVSATPLTFTQAAAFQWVNPKAWAMALTTITNFTPAERPASSIFLAGVIFAAVNFPCITSWTLVGTQIKKFLTNQFRRRAFNYVAALLLLSSLYPILAAR